jgi:hypothetical protein
MNRTSKNTKKVRKTTKSATKGAIFLVYPKSTFSSDPSIVRKAANNSDVLISNMRKVMAGGTNSNLETYEKCAEALEKRLLIIEIPDTTELNIILTKDGSKIDNLWKFPYTKDYHTLMDFLLTIFGNDEIPQPFDEEMFKLVATLSAAANKKGMGVGGMLVSAANDYAVSKGLRVKPVCSFASAWYERHPQFMDIIDRV